MTDSAEERHPALSLPTAWAACPSCHTLLPVRNLL